MDKFIRRFFGVGIVCAFVLLAPLRVSAAVTISSFDAKWQSGKVVVNWKTASELSNAGFNILRSTAPNGTFTKVYNIAAQFGNIAGATYSFTDSGVTAGQTYYYRLQSINTSGGVETYSGTAVATAPAAPTATATATHTRTPTRTATLAPGAPTLTPAPPTVTATAPPQFTPTRTRTYPPGVTPPTPVPATPTVRVAYAVQPTAPGKAGAAPGVVSPEPTRVALAVKETESETPEESEEEIAAAPDESDVRAKQLLIGGGILLLGVMGAGGLLLGIIAIYLSFRARSEM
jgi:hypothetical protein